jgi:hypothetical protein
MAELNALRNRGIGFADTNGFVLRGLNVEILPEVAVVVIFPRGDFVRSGVTYIFSNRIGVAKS